MKIAAVDPGLSGAAVALEQIGGTVMLLSLIDLPVMGEVPSTGSMPSRSRVGSPNTHRHMSTSRTGAQCHGRA
jgi:hypothetical protein